MGQIKLARARLSFSPCQSIYNNSSSSNNKNNGTTKKNNGQQNMRCDRLRFFLSRSTFIVVCQQMCSISNENIECVPRDVGKTSERRNEQKEYTDAQEISSNLCGWGDISLEIKKRERTTEC